LQEEAPNRHKVLRSKALVLNVVVIAVALNMVAPHRFSSAAAKSFAAHVGGTIIDIAAVLELAPERFKGTSSGTGRPNPEPDRSRSST
jgi:hypothetical protein